MNLGCISREYYIGRYIYLTRMIAELPDVRPGNKCGSEILSLYLSDQNTGRRIRRRISRASSLWDQYYEYALKRERLESQLKNLLTSWSEDYSGALSKEASKYKIIPPKKSYYNSAMWESFKSNDCDVPNDFPVFYKSFVMRGRRPSSRPAPWPGYRASSPAPPCPPSPRPGWAQNLLVTTWI